MKYGYGNSCIRMFLLQLESSDRDIAASSRGPGIFLCLCRFAKQHRSDRAGRTCRAASVRRDPVARGEKPIEVSNHTTAKRKASELGQVFRIVPEDASKYVAGGEYPVPGNPERAEASQSLPGHWRWRAAIGQSRTG
jgi:hypothetical protein